MSIAAREEKFEHDLKYNTELTIEDISEKELLGTINNNEEYFYRRFYKLQEYLFLGQTSIEKLNKIINQNVDNISNLITETEKNNHIINELKQKNDNLKN